MMSNNLSPDEINALLAGTPGGEVNLDEDLDELLEGLASQLDVDLTAEEPPVAADNEAQSFSDMLSDIEIDALGEIGNISMGTAATTLSSLLDHKVEITTPRVSMTTLNEMASLYPMPFVSVEVKYTVGLEGINCLFLHENDVKIISGLMMDEKETDTTAPLTEMHLSCISECMNQMVGSSSTSLSQMFGLPIDISPPKATTVRFDEGLEYPFHESTTPVVRISFNMVVEGLIDSEIMQVMPLDFAKETVDKMLGNDSGAKPEQSAERSSIFGSAGVEYSSPLSRSSAQPAAAPPPPPPAPPVPQQQYAAPPPPPAPAASGNVSSQPPVDVRPASFASFGDPASQIPFGDNMDILLDVPLSVSVEIGKSKKYIKDILDFNTGTIVVLDKMAGDMVDVVVNGKLIAKGEVVIIDDSYGCRITEIVSPSKRI